MSVAVQLDEEVLGIVRAGIELQAKQINDDLFCEEYDTE